MATPEWSWKSKDGKSPGLLYESGNWGDILKAVWIGAVLRWKRKTVPAVDYLDPFAGDVSYPMSRKTAHRLALAGLAGLAYLEEPFFRAGRWPSAAGAALLLAGGEVELWDADAGRRENWRACPGVAVPEAESGWDLLAARTARPGALWLVDPYDFLAEWRARLGLLVDKAADTTILVYLYNRAGRSREAFADYRAFRNALEDAWPWEKRLGRVAADPFLPESHHEMLLLPGGADRRRDDLPLLFDELLAETVRVNAALDAASVFDC